MTTRVVPNSDASCWCERSMVLQLSSRLLFFRYSHTRTSICSNTTPWKELISSSYLVLNIFITYSFQEGYFSCHSVIFSAGKTSTSAASVTTPCDVLLLLK